MLPGCGRDFLTQEEDKIFVRQGKDRLASGLDNAVHCESKVLRGRQRRVVDLNAKLPRRVVERVLGSAHTGRGSLYRMPTR